MRAMPDDAARVLCVERFVAAEATLPTEPCAYRSLTRRCSLS